MIKMSPPTNDVTNGVVVGAPGDLVAPARLPTPAINSSGDGTPTAVQGITTSATGDNKTTTTPANVPQKRSSTDFIFGKVIGEGSFSTVSRHESVRRVYYYVKRSARKKEREKEKLGRAARVCLPEFCFLIARGGGGGRGQVNEFFEMSPAAAG